MNIYVPKDRVTSMHQGYGFVEYMTEDDAEYAAKYALCPPCPPPTLLI